MLMSGEQSAGQNHNKELGNILLDMLKEFRYLETNQNCICEEITSRLNSWGACCVSVQSLCFPVCYTNLKSKI